MIKRFHWKGFDIKIIDNCWYSHRYEYRIFAKSAQARAICARNGYGYEFPDPTSMPDKHSPIQYAHYRVNELSSPMYFKLERFK